MTALHAASIHGGDGAAAGCVENLQGDKRPATAASSPATEHTAISEVGDIVRNNEEYMLVYRAIEALKAQLCRAKSDMGILVSLRKHALAQPLEYVESVVSGTAPAAPPRQEVVDVPLVDADVYLHSASPAAAARYAAFAPPPRTAPARMHAAVRAGPAVQRSKPVRSAAPRSHTLVRTKQQYSGEPLTANAGQLTGNTAVATPEHSPVRSGHDSLEAAGMRTAPIGVGRVAGHLDGAWASPQTAPRVIRANTEPVGAMDGGGGATQAATLPSTPTRSSKSQKVFTSKMLAEFRRQASDNNGDDEPPLDEHQVCSSGINGAHHQGSDKPLLLSGIHRVLPPGTNSDDSSAAAKREQARNFSRPGSAKPKSKAKAKAHGTTRGGSSGDNMPKPPSYNQAWSDEEQMRLEQLLAEFPEEEVANHRWRKISEALGTRTMRQVASRVQKYFIKLAKAGLPVPGRVPDTSGWTSIGRNDSGATAAATPPASRPGRRKRKRVDFTSSEGEDDEEIGDIDIDMDGRSDDDTAAPPVDRKGKQVDWLGGAFDDGAAGFELGPAMASSSSSAAAFQTPALRSAKAVHLGYRCDSCLAEPIVGIRWHCLECHGAHTVDLCDECREEGVFETDRHIPTHSFHARREAEMEPYYANEVAAPALHEYSYLA
ncbi:hypothetical protein H4R19_002566 [Coemansia spiralis]|nr:hypothetical protein H4R19_002566 [Coemansia spiralis]